RVLRASFLDVGDVIHLSGRGRRYSSPIRYSASRKMRLTTTGDICREFGHLAVLWPRAANVPNSLRKGPFRGSEAVRRGIVTKRQLRSSAWCRLFHDVYLHAAVPMTHALLCRAVQLLLPSGAAISGGSAAFLYGANVLQRDAPVEVTLPPRVWM